MKKKIGIAAAVILGILAVCYIGFAVFFQSHFCFGTTIDGIEAGGCSIAKVEQLIEEEIGGYELTLVEREDQTETITASQIGAAPVFHGEIEELLADQNAFAWPGILFGKSALELEKTVAFDDTKFSGTIEALSCMQEENQRKPVDASCSGYSAADGYTLVPADYGTTIDETALKNAVAEAVEGLEDTLDLEKSGCYVDPAVGDDDKDLLAVIDELNQYVASTVTYDFGDQKEVVDGSTISEWLSVLDGELEVDEEAVLDYVKGLAKTYNTAYKPKTLKTSYGPEVTISNGAYGWKIDTEGEVAQLLEDIKSGKSVEREPVYSQTANSHGENDYGNSYVEINLTSQHLFVYKNGSLVVDSDFVSGNLSKGHGSPTGAFIVTYTTTDAVLRGEDYATPGKSWMPFAGDVGMHDASWRKSFGGNIYKTNGSHGCINLPTSVAKTIYNTIEKGWPVLVYTLPGTESAAQLQQDAQTVIDLINSIGEVTADSETVIASARSQYDALPDSTKANVTNYDVLVAAEAALAQIKAAGEQTGM